MHVLVKLFVREEIKNKLNSKWYEENIHMLFISSVSNFCTILYVCAYVCMHTVIRTGS
jgi:hypothetical protein